MGPPRFQTGDGRHWDGGQGGKYNNSRGQFRRGRFQKSVHQRLGFGHHQQYSSGRNQPSTIQRTIVNVPRREDTVAPENNFGSSRTFVQQIPSIVSAPPPPRVTFQGGPNPFRDSNTAWRVQVNQTVHNQSQVPHRLPSPFNPSVDFSRTSLQSLNPFLTEQYAGNAGMTQFGVPLQTAVSQSVGLPDESVSSSATFTDRTGVRRLKKQLCKNYFGPRGCKNGDECTFMHKDFPCWQFHVEGQCPDDGAQCKFSHEELSPLKRGILLGNVRKYRELFPRMHPKQVQEAIDRVASARAAEKGSCGGDDNGIINIGDSSGPSSDDEEPNCQTASHIPSTSQFQMCNIGLSPISSATSDRQLYNSPVIFNSTSSTASATTNGNNSERSLHEIVQRTRRVIHQNETLRGEVATDVFPVNQSRGRDGNRQEASPLFATITKSVVFKGLPDKAPKGRATVDAIISSCIGHGPPYTNWQICQIYNTCAQNGLNLDTSDLQNHRSSFA